MSSKFTNSGAILSGREEVVPLGMLRKPVDDLGSGFRPVGVDAHHLWVQPAARRWVWAPNQHIEHTLDHQ